MVFSRKNKIIIIILILLGIFALNYSSLDSKLSTFLIQEKEYETAKVSRIVDGDTIEVEFFKNNSFEKEKVRLLGINTPEKGEAYSKESTKFLEEKILNKTINLEYGPEKRDRYKRILAYVHFDRENINLKIVEEGFANPYFPSGKTMHYSEFAKAWNSCLDKNINICKKSEDVCSNCIILKEFNYKNQEAIFNNQCNFNCDLSGWEIKDEGRKKYIFKNFNLPKKEEFKIIVGEGEDSEEVLFWKNEKYVWTRTGDTLFLRDEEKNLVLWERY